MEPIQKNDTQNAAENRAQDTSFRDRHKKELGVGAYAKESVVEGLLPWIIAGAAAVAGYFTLGRPIKAIAPKMFGGADLVADVAGLAKREGVSSVAGKIQAGFSEMHTAFMQNNPDVEFASLAGLEKFAKNFTNPQHVARLRATLGLPASEGLKTAKAAGAAAGALTGAIAGGTVVGYHKWKKEESTRLAAAEINEDVSKLELFRPSDPELVAENKRLRAMLAKEDKGSAEVPETTGISQMQHEGAVKPQELSAQVG